MPLKQREGFTRHHPQEMDEVRDTGPFRSGGTNVSSMQATDQHALSEIRPEALISVFIGLT